MASQSLFDRIIGIDYSGAGTPLSRLSGLRVYVAEGEAPPAEILPPGPRSKLWTRRAAAEWLLAQLSAGPPSLVGIDHAFSFPLRYFERHGLPLDWDAFLGDFLRHWPTDADDVSVQLVRDGHRGQGRARDGDSRWRRIADVRAGGAKSPFHFDVPGSVAKSTHAGLPWLRFIRRALPGRIHFWPFDGWTVPPGRSVVAEVYPALWSQAFPREGRSPDQHDAYAIAACLQRADQGGGLAPWFTPTLSEEARTAARVEGWILGVR